MIRTLQLSTLAALTLATATVAHATEAPEALEHALITATAPATTDTTLQVEAPADDEPFKRMYHGFRLGYTYVNGITPESSVPSPHMFVIGYELTQRFQGGDWLNVITVQNVSVSGINQSLFLPSLNGLVGFEIKEQLQIGTGVNLFPFDPDGKYIHQIIAVGWTPPAGDMNLPVHFIVIPDTSGNWRLGATVGVNW